MAMETDQRLTPRAQCKAARRQLVPGRRLRRPENYVSAGSLPALA
jgi:hypothetical protein